ncbi:DUF4118 domain-containing protein [Antarcticibacterium arcticum]|uniref:histidine kinase n=1 Tax=Antarcticibacterium arcticum TaxID=2585771 RepID=A0A5B8YNN0_9FLAO|nr:DUF4118 domain-containing protein [Antarcticibacterium arcticum]
MGSILFISLVCYFFIPLIGYHVVALILLLAVSILAIFFEILPVVIMAVLSALIWNFLFIPPQYTFKINTPEDALLFLMYFVIAVMNAVFTTKIRKAEATARRRKEKEKTIALYNTMLNSLSHELKTPIAAVISAVDTLQEHQSRLSESQATELYAEIETASQRLNRQVGNLLNMSRLESDFIQIQKDWHDLNEILYKVINLNFQEVVSEKIRFTEDETLPLVKIDAALTEQIFHNILHNALQYTPAKSKIEIKATYENGCAVVSIADNGKGIPEDKLSLIFEKFYRLPETAAGGTGLGLSIAQGFAKAQNGTIFIKNRKTGGAEFIINLPAESIHPKDYSNE